MKAKITRKHFPIGVSSYSLTLQELTTGKLIAITRALRYYNSSLSDDVLDFIRNAIVYSGDKELTKEIETSLTQLTNKMEENLREAQKTISEVENTIKKSHGGETHTQ